MALVTLKCPQCGGQLKVNGRSKTVICTYCGNEHLVVRDGGLRPELRETAVCPVCGQSDLVEKASVIEASGSALSTKLSPPRRPLRIKMPPQPNREDWLARRRRTLVWGLIALIVAYLLLLSSFLGYVEGRSSNLEGTVLLLVLAASGTWFFLRWRKGSMGGLEGGFEKLMQEHRREFDRLQKIADEEWKTYRRAMDGWGRLYYCRRDDCVFLPGSDDSVPPERMRELLEDDGA